MTATAKKAKIPIAAPRGTSLAALLSPVSVVVVVRERVVVDPLVVDDVDAVLAVVEMGSGSLVSSMGHTVHACPAAAQEMCAKQLALAALGQFAS